MVESKNETSIKAQQQKNLITKCDEAGAALATADRDDMRARYKVGRIVGEVMDEAKYGQNAVEVMEEKLRRDKKTLYRYARVAQLWPAAEFERLVRKKDAAGLPVTWSHLEVLVEVEDGRVRKGLLSKALKKCWSVRTLRAEIENLEPASSRSKKVKPLVAIGRLARSLDPLAEVARNLEAKALPVLLSKKAKPSKQELAGLKASWKRLDIAHKCLGGLLAKVSVVLERGGRLTKQPAKQPAKQRVVEA